MHYNPQIDSIYQRGTNGAGVLLLHGFTGTPDSLRSVINALHHEGFTVSAPLLAGHGTTPEQCGRTGWQEWLTSAQKAFMELSEKCPKIFVGGLSLGALLSLKLAADSPRSISAIACLATPLQLKAWIKTLLPVIWQTPLKLLWKYQKKVDVDIKDEEAKKNFWNYDLMPLSCIVSILEFQDIVQRSMTQIKTPVLLIHSRHDSTAPYSSMNAIASRVASPVTETVTLENSYHVITLDFEKEIVAQKTCQFFTRFL